jgi:hypothetical protein
MYVHHRKTTGCTEDINRPWVLMNDNYYPNVGI